jgi:lipopolysaccharide biosynthesis glycosyltransferase
MNFKYTIVTSADEAFSLGLRLLVKSINRLWKSGADLHIIVLDNGLSRESIRTLTEVALHQRPNLSISFVDVQSKIPVNLPSFRVDASNATYARLWIPELVDSSDALYVDADFVFAADPKPLIDTSRLKKEPICAVRDEIVSDLFDDIGSYQGLKADVHGEFPYFNSGLMHWKLDHPIFSGLLESSRKLFCDSTFHPSYADQSVLNYLGRGNVWFLESKENYFAFGNRSVLNWRGKENLHFIAACKPFVPGTIGWRYLLRKLVFDLLLYERADVEQFMRDYESSVGGLKQRFKRLRYKLFKRRRYEKLIEEQFDRREVDSLVQFVYSYLESEWNACQRD